MMTLRGGRTQDDVTRRGERTQDDVTLRGGLTQDGGDAPSKDDRRTQDDHHTASKGRGG